MKKIINNEIFIGNLEDISVDEEIKRAYSDSVSIEIDKISSYDQECSIGPQENKFRNEKIRKCYVSWLDTSKSNFIENGMRKIIQNVNNMIWNMKLENEWDGGIQFTKYIEKNDHYAWHKDFYPEDNHIKIERKISLVYCLSKKSDYNGGEFQIKLSDGSNFSTKFDCGDFIVFPSNKLHRVKPLRSGTRITMVGWYR